MKRYGDYLVKDTATLYAITVRFDRATLSAAKCDIRTLAWQAERYNHREELQGLKRLSGEIRDLPTGGFEEIEYYCAPDGCVYKPRWKKVRVATLQRSNQ